MENRLGWLRCRSMVRARGLGSGAGRGGESKMSGDGSR